MAKPGTWAFGITAKDEASTVISRMGTLAKNDLKDMGAAAKIAGDALTTGFINVAKLFAFVGNAIKGIVITLNAFVQGIIGVGRIVTATIGGIISIFRALFSIIKAIAQTIIAIFRAIGEAVMGLFRSLMGAIMGLFGLGHGYIATFVKYTMGALAAVTAAIIGTAIAAEHAWQPMSDAIARIGIIGAGAAVKGLREFSVEMRRATGIGSAAMVALAEQALRLGIPADKLKAVTATAVGLSYALGITAADAMSKLGAAMDGDTAGLQRLIPGLKGAGSEAEKMALIMGIARQGIDLAASKTSTFAGLWQSFKSVLAENSVLLGEKIAPGIKLIVDALRPLLGLLESSGDGFAAMFNSAAKFLVPVITAMVKGFAIGLSAVIAFGQTLITEWRLVWELVKGTVLFYWNEIWANGDAWAHNMMAILSWLGSNIFTWLQQLGEVLKEAFSAMFAALYDMAKFSWDQMFIVMMGGKAMGSKEYLHRMGVEWSSAMMTGWKKGLETFTAPTALPPMVSRTMTAAQAALDTLLKWQQSQLGKSLGINFDAQIAAFRAILAGGAKGKAKDAVSGLEIGPGKGGGSGGNMLESRFLTRAPGGLTPTEQLLTNSLQVQRDQLAEERKKATEERKTQRALLNLDKTIQFMANTMSLVD